MLASSLSESPAAADNTARDDALVRRAAAGDHGAETEIIELYHGDIARFVARMVPNRHDAADIVQNTFIDAVHALRAGVGFPMTFQSWLYGVARNRAHDHRRHAGLFERLREAFSRRPTETPLSPAQLATGADDCADLWRGVRARLSRREFEVMVLRFGQGLSVEETARIIGGSAHTVNGLVKRGRQTLWENHFT